MKGDIAFAGFVLTANEWQELDPHARAQLIAVATNKADPMMVDAPIDLEDSAVELIEDVDDGWDLGNDSVTVHQRKPDFADTDIDDALERQYLGRRFSTGSGPRFAKGTTPPLEARATPNAPIVARPAPKLAQGSGPMAVQPADPAEPDDFAFDLMPDAIPPSY